MTRNRPAFIATVIIALLAAGLAVFALWQMSGGGNAAADNDDNHYSPTDAQNSEMTSAMERLIKANYEIVKLYYVYGLPTIPEPYGNVPEDGILTVDSDKYKTLQDIEKLVDSAFVSETAEKIKNNPSGNGPLYFDRDGRLGISYNFSPDANYPINWENPGYTLIPVSETECNVIVRLKKNDQEVDYRTSMVKEEGKWLLTKTIYQ